MNRLVDSKDRTPTMQKARDVLMLARPAPAGRERMQRVRWGLDQRVRSRPLRRTPLLLAAALVFVGASALAGIGAAVVTANRSEPNEAAPARFSETPAELARPKPARDSTASELGATRPPEEQTSGASSGDTAPPRTGRPVAQQRANVEANADVERVHNAAAALRREGDPAKAAKLLESLAARKSGPLAEEALALRIEAAVAQRDPRAREFARSYLSRYPKGRYAAAARDALRSPPR